MGYYSDLRIAITKRDYIAMLKKDEKNLNKCKNILNNEYGYITEYKENNIECVVLQQYDLKYYKEFEEVKQLEEYLSETRSGYVFVRTGERWNDIEYRNTSKLKELEKPFEFIKIIEEKTKEQILNKSKKYKITSEQYVFTDKKDILEYCESNSELCKSIKEQYDKGIQYKLILTLDANDNNASVMLFARKPEEQEFKEIKSDEIDKESALWFLGYANEEEFLNDINDYTNNKENEEEFC